MSDETVAEVLKRVDALAAKLGIGADALWAILLKQARIAFISDMILLVATGIGWWLFFKYLIPLAKRQADDGDFPAYAIGAFLAGFFLMFVSIAFVLCAENIAGSLLNPEYWAFKQLVALKK